MYVQYTVITSTVHHLMFINTSTNYSTVSRQHMELKGGVQYIADGLTSLNLSFW